MSCGCEAKKKMSDIEYVSELARKAAIMEQCMYVVCVRPDGSYCFNKYGSQECGTIVELRHYL